MSNILFITLCLIQISTYGCKSEELIELNYELNSESLYFPGPGTHSFNLTTLREGVFGNYWYKSSSFCSPEHLGTHVDAPSHFYQQGLTVEQIPLKHLIAQGVVIDVREKVRKNSIYQLTAADVTQWVETYGPMPNNSLVLVLTGWNKRYGNRVSYYGHATDVKKFIFPGVSVRAVETLLGFKESEGIHVVGIGIDTPSLDNGPSQDYPSHVALAKANGYGIEIMTNLEKLPPSGAEITVMPMKITGGSGAPARVVARFGSRMCSGSTTSGLAAALYIFVALSIYAGWN